MRFRSAWSSGIRPARTNHVRTSGVPRACPRWTRVCYFDKQVSNQGTPKEERTARWKIHFRWNFATGQRQITGLEHSASRRSSPAPGSWASPS